MGASPQTPRQDADRARGPLKFAFLIEPPFNFRNDAGTVTGSDVELARTALAMAGIDDVELVEAEFAELLPGLAQGRWHMTTGLFSTDERRKSVAFSRPIWGLPDGLLVPKGNPKRLTGYKSIAQTSECRLAVIRDQIQHQSAMDLGVTPARIRIFETYKQAALAVSSGKVDAYASVARAHSGFLAQNQHLELETVTVSRDEKQPAFGAFAFNKSDNELRAMIDSALSSYLGTQHHLAMMKSFGFTEAEIAVGATPV